MTNTLEGLLALRLEKLNARNQVVQYYAEVQGIASKKELKQIKTDYQRLREEVYEVEDKIAEIDSETLDDIVEPNPEDIEVAVAFLPTIGLNVRCPICKSVIGQIGEPDPFFPDFTTYVHNENASKGKVKYSKDGKENERVVCKECASQIDR